MSQPITTEMLQRITTLSNPHMKAINDAITAAFPEHPDAMYTAALAFHLFTLLDNLNPANRPAAIDLINSFLARLRYRLSALS